VSDYTAKRIEDIEAIRGVFRRVRDAIGVSSFGINILDYPPNAEFSPDHAEPEQEEVYVTLRGAGEIDVQGERVELDPEVIIRVGAGTRHKMLPGPEGMRVLALGGVPGKPYEPPDMSRIAIDGEGAENPDYTVRRFEEMERTLGGGMLRARAELGVTSFGIQVIELPAGETRYPEHDHSGNGQEEVYLALDGEAEIELDGERVRLDPETIVRVGPAPRRRIVTGEKPARIVALGATPNAVYEPIWFTELGAPDPLDR
jgi:mannose-6-phosphate isomerase-like protein (cupin superfamily)